MAEDSKISLWVFSRIFKEIQFPQLRKINQLDKEFSNLLINFWSNSFPPPLHNTSEHLSKGKGETTPLVFKYFYQQNALSNYAYTFQGKKRRERVGKKGPHTEKTHHVWYSQVKS